MERMESESKKNSHVHRGGNMKENVDMFNYKWSDAFTSEESLIEYLRGIDVKEYKRKRYKGCQYIEGFKKQLEEGKELSKKQVTQLKRISKEIYMYYKWD